MTDEFGANMLGRVGRGCFAGVEFLKRTLRWHEQEDVLQLERGHTVCHRDRRVAWTYRHSSGDEDTNSGDKGNRWRRSRCLGPLDTIQAATFRSAVGLIGHIVLDRPDCQCAPKAVSPTRELPKLDWMRMMRLAEFLVAHSELEWLYQAQDVPEKYVVYGD